MSDDLVDRLRGIYRIPIKDGLGPVGAGEEPDNPDAFVRKFPSTPIQMEAAAEITRLRAQLADEIEAREAAEKRVAELEAAYQQQKGFAEQNAVAALSWCDTSEKEAARAETAEAALAAKEQEVARLREAIHVCAEFKHDCVAKVQIARAALTPKGDTP